MITQVSKGIALMALKKFQFNVEMAVGWIFGKRDSETELLFLLLFLLQLLLFLLLMLLLYFWSSSLNLSLFFLYSYLS
jgi:hypothetical protein